MLAFLESSFAAKSIPFRIVLDPGHGGSDSGTQVELGPNSIAEKDISLALAQEMAQLFKPMKGIEVRLTRTDDSTLSLPARSQFANRTQAHLFISLHVNAKAQYNLSDSNGVETYILNTKTQATSERLAQFENSETSGALDSAPLSGDVWRILKDFKHDTHIGKSKELACWIQNEMAFLPSRPKNRGIKQALFHVLLGAEMPSVLVEVGFLSNQLDRSRLLSPKGRTAIAQAIVRAVEHFRNRERPNPENCPLL